MTFKTMGDVRAANSQITGHWFDRDTMQFFNTRIESQLIAGRYFITSERRDNTFPRLFSVRQALPDGRIETVGRFQAYESKEAALAALEAIR
jgi:hypothetical protein